MIYLDNAATTQIAPEVLDAMMPYLKEDFGNAGTMYSLGRKAADAVAKARQQVADLIGSNSYQIIFTSGGSEANSLVFEGLKPYLLANNKTHIITSATEHDSILKSVRSLCSSKNNIKSGFDAAYLKPDQNGSVSSENVDNSITEQTGLTSVMTVNNETGAVNPTKTIGSLCKSKNILFHSDCVQAVGAFPIKVEEMNCDFLSISAHKIHAPKGIGALYAKKPSLLSPVIHGGAEQEFGFRGGTENVAGIVGFGKACEILSKNLCDNEKKTFDLRKSFLITLEDCLRGLNIIDLFHINTHGNCKILNLRFDGIDGQTLLLLLDSKGICISAGSACRSHESEPSHVLLAMGLSEEAARNSIRISFSHTQTEDEIVCAAKAVAECVSALNYQNKYI